MTSSRFGLVRTRTTALLLATTLAAAYACNGGDDSVTPLDVGSSTGKRPKGGGAGNGGSAGIGQSGNTQSGGKSGSFGVGGAAGSAGKGGPSSLASFAIDPPTLDLSIDDGKSRLVPFKAIK